MIIIELVAHLSENLNLETEMLLEYLFYENEQLSKHITSKALTKGLIMYVKVSIILKKLLVNRGTNSFQTLNNF